jgi:hypothetical protein
MLAPARAKRSASGVATATTKSAHRAHELQAVRRDAANAEQQVSGMTPPTPTPIVARIAFISGHL